MNKTLQEILSSQELTNVFDSLYRQDEISPINMLLFTELMRNDYKRFSSTILDLFLHTQNPPTQTIDQTVTTFREYCESKLNKQPTDNLTFLKYFKDRLKNEVLRGIFTKSDNAEVLQNYKIDAQGLARFREEISFIASVLKPNPEKIKDDLFISIAQDNLDRFQAYVKTCSDMSIKEMYDNYMGLYNSFIQKFPPEVVTEEVKQIYGVLLKTKLVDSYINLPEIYQANDNLPYRKIRRNVHLGFDKNHFDALKLFTNLIQCYELGLVDEGIVFNGEYFIDHATGSRVTESTKPITVQNIHTIGRFNQAGFILPENLVYGFQNTPLNNDFSFTLSQENVTAAEQYNGFGYPLTYATKNGFFGKKQCEFSKTVTTTNPQNQQVKSTYYYYTPVENDTDEKYVKVVEENLDTQQISIALYVFPLNHINTGVQICRIDSNDPSFMAHNIGGKERISTIFHMHKYNIIDQVRSEGEGEFDIMLKLDDNLTHEQALQIFDSVCSTGEPPQKVYDEQNRLIDVNPSSSGMSKQELAKLREDAVTIPIPILFRTLVGNENSTEEFAEDSANKIIESVESTTQKISTPPQHEPTPQTLVKPTTPQPNGVAPSEQPN